MATQTGHVPSIVRVQTIVIPAFSRHCLSTACTRGRCPVESASAHLQGREPVQTRSSFPAMSLPPPNSFFALFRSEALRAAASLLPSCFLAPSPPWEDLAAFKLISPALRKPLLPGRISPELSLPPASQTPQELALPSEQGCWFPGGIFEQFLARILARTLRHLENAFSARQHKRRSQNNVKSCSNQLGETDGGAMPLAKVLFLGKPQAPGRLRGLPDCPASSPLLLLLHFTLGLAGALLWLLSTCCQGRLRKGRGVR